MTGSLPHRYICFCGATVIGTTVCSACSEVMVRSLLKALPPRPYDAPAADGAPDPDSAAGPLGALAI